MKRIEEIDQQEQLLELLKKRKEMLKYLISEKEKALKTTLKSENADANQIKTAIFDLAFEKYNCIS